MWHTPVTTHIQLHAQLHVKGRPETLLQSEATMAGNGIVAPCEEN